jgi:hypothetical protein
MARQDISSARLGARQTGLVGCRPGEVGPVPIYAEGVARGDDYLVGTVDGVLFCVREMSG